MMQKLDETENDKIVSSQLKIYMPELVREKIRGWVNGCPTECGGLGTVTTMEDGTIIVDDVFIFRQIASGGYFRLCNKNRSAFEVQLIRGTHSLVQGVYPQDMPAEKDLPTDPVQVGELQKKVSDARKAAGQAIYSRMRFHWHSHVDMGVFWSGTDVAAADDMLRAYTWAIMLVSNKRGEVKVKLVSKNPRFILDDLELVVYQEDRWKGLHEECKKEVKELVMSYSEYDYDEDKDEIVKATARSGYPSYRKGYWDDDATAERTQSMRFSQERGSLHQGSLWPVHVDNHRPTVRCLLCGTENKMGLLTCTACKASLLEPNPEFDKGITHGQGTCRTAVEDAIFPSE